MPAKVKLRLGEIDWAEIEAGQRDDPARADGLIDFAEVRRQVAKASPYILTPEFGMRMAAACAELATPEVVDWPLHLPDAVPTVLQFDSPEGSGPATSTIVIATPHRLLILPIPTGGYMFYDEHTPEPDGGMHYRYHIPRKFAYRMSHGDEAAADNYARTMGLAVRVAVAMLQQPEEIRVERRESKRTVSKGRPLRLPEHRVVSLYPGTEHVIRERIGQMKAATAKRATPAQHDVHPHWISRRLDPECAHDFEDITTPEVLRRERCTLCGGHRTFRRSFKRGDPNKALRPKLHVVH
jgi:hypothetical protein